MNFLNFVEIDYDDDDIECNIPLLEGSVLTATSALNERGPENARLNGKFFYFISTFSVFMYDLLKLLFVNFGFFYEKIYVIKYGL